VEVYKRSINSAKAKEFFALYYHIVTFKDLQKLVQSQSGPEQSQLLQRLRDKPFWINSEKEHKERDIRTKGDCCFNHIIGLPRKDGVEKPIFDYERFLYDALMRPGFMNNRTPSRSDQCYHRVYDNYLEARKVQNNIIHHFKEKHLWVKKATGPVQCLYEMVEIFMFFLS
jgi:hypothetical protein